MEVYLDNAATTKCDTAVAEKMSQILCEDYGNPSSMHGKGVTAERHIREAADAVAKVLKCIRQELVFTASGTEADNLALFGAAHAKKRTGRHIITTPIEHPAVAESVKALAEEGFDVSYLPVGSDGIVSLDALSDLLRDDTILVSVMHVNNETGSVQPLRAIGEIVKRRCPEALFHTDAVQGFGKVPLSVKQCNLDLLSVSAHKLHGPKGVGCLYVKKGTRLTPLVLGGGQQQGLRSGTEDVAGIAGFGLAAQLAFTDAEEKQRRMRSLRRQLHDGILQSLDGVTFNGSFDDEDDAADLKSAPHILSMSVEGVRAEVLLHALEEKGIYVSAGSACSSNHPHPSDTLQAIGLQKELLESTIRLSLSSHTTPDEIEYTVATLAQIVPVLRQFTRV